MIYPDFSELQQRLYFIMHNPKPYTVNMELGEVHYSTDKYEKLYNLTELEIVEEAIKHSLILQNLFCLMGINFSNSWIAANVPTNVLLKDWKYPKPGDIDIIAGNFDVDKKTPDFNNILGIQVKIRKVEHDNEIKKGFASKNKSADQTYYTSLMGFHKALLLHVFVKDPAPPPIEFTPIWNNAWNRDFYERVCKASYNLIKDKLMPEVFGYAWLGWGQAYRSNYKLSGNILEQLIVSPPYNPFANSEEVLSNRLELKSSLNDLIYSKPIEKYPHIIYM